MSEDRELQQAMLAEFNWEPSVTAAHIGVTANADEVSRILGPVRFDADVAQHASMQRVATGLAWTPAGGDILFIEASRMPGSGKLILTG